MATSSYPVFTYQPYSLALAGRIAEVVKEFEVPVVHAHYAIPHSVAAFLARELLHSHFKIVTTLHGTDITILGIDSIFRGMTTLALERSDAVTVVSEWLLNETLKHFSYRGDLELIYNFVNPAIFHPNQPDAPRIKERFAPGEQALFIHVSNYRGVKRAPLVVEIFSRVRAETPAHLLMVGEGPDHAQAVQVASELRISDDVTFLDSVMNLPPYLASADLFLMPSLSESFGLAGLEAMACGTPVMGTRIGGLPELIDDGVDGMLFDPEDIQGMASCAVSLVNDRERIRKLSENARQKPEKKFPYERMVSLYESLYLKLLNQPG